MKGKSLKCSILQDLKNEKWPTYCIIKRNSINNYIRKVQSQILLCKKKYQLDFISTHIFDIRNRIFSIDKIFNQSKNSCYKQMGYSDLTFKFHKFILLKQTKLANMIKLPVPKKVEIKMSKNDTNGNLFNASMPIDKVLQCMLLNFLDVLIEEKLKPEIFAY